LLFIAGYKSIINSIIDDYIEEYNLNIPKYIFLHSKPDVEFHNKLFFNFVGKNIYQIPSKK
jgi:hypothetical protein